MYLPRVLPHFLHINFATGETRNGSVVRGRPASEAFQQLAKHEPPLQCESFEVHGCLGSRFLGVRLMVTMNGYH